MKSKRLFLMFGKGAPIFEECFLFNLLIRRNNLSKTYYNSMEINWNVLFCLLGIFGLFRIRLFFQLEKLRIDKTYNVAAMNANNIESQGHKASTLMLSNTNIQNTILVVFVVRHIQFRVTFSDKINGKEHWRLFFYVISQYWHFMKHTVRIFISFSKTNACVSQNKHS